MKPLLAMAFEGNCTLPLIWPKIIMYSIAKGSKALSMFVCLFVCFFPTKGNSVSNLRDITSKNTQYGWALEEMENN